MTRSSTSAARGYRPGLRLRRAGLTTLLSIGLLAGSLPAAAPASAATLSFTSIADSYTNSARPTSNYGTQTSMRVRSSSTSHRAYLRFTVAGLDAPVQSAKLRLYVVDVSPQGGTVHRTSGAWTESGLNWNNAPALESTVLATAGKVVAGTWIELDVTAAVTGNGDLNLGIQTTSSNSTLYASREAAEDPTLVVTTASAPPPAPVANFSGTPLTGTAPLQVAFTDLSTDTPTSWAWDFQNDGTVDSTSKNPTFTYSSAGSYDVSLTVANAGGSDSKLVIGYVVASPPPAPVANFSGTPLTGTAPLQVAFTDLSTNTPTSWAWDFQNDGTVDSTSKNPTFTYSSAGSYDVSLTVANAGGSHTKTVGDYVVVSTGAAAPVAQFSATPTDGIAPLQVTFTDHSTNAPTAWAWDFQNDGTTDSTVQNPIFTYATPGSYDVRLTVSNTGGSDSQVIADFIVVGAPPPAPVADFSATPTSGAAPLAVVFTDASSNAPTSWAWDFQNDGTNDSTAQNPTFVYSSPGTFTVRLTATNPGGSDAETKTGLIVVGGGGGGGTLTFVPDADSQVKSTSPTGNYGTAVSLRLRNSSEIYRSYLKFTVSGLTGAPTGAKLRLLVADSSPDGGRIHTVANTWTETGITWDNAPVISGTALSSVGPVTIGTWIEFDVSAAVTGNGTYSFGILNNSSDSALYSSRESADSPELIVATSQTTPPPIAGFTGVPTSGSAPLNVQFTDTSTNGPNAWAWDFQNDGIVDSTVRNARFTYTAPGTYSVKLTASNSGGSGTFVRTSYVTVTAGPVAGPDDVTFVGAGDIASCSSTGDEATAALIDGIAGTVYTTGDNAYETGTASEFANCYEPSWGRFKARTRPSVGNHEYGTPNASGYFGYFGSAAGDPTKGYYSYDLGQWHIVVLNSNCSEIGGCGVGSPQETWLRQDLAANTDSCTLGIWHEPRFNSGVGGGATFMVPLLQALYDDGAEIVLNGHMHFYERFAPQTPAGVANALTGIRQFTVGTGGKSLAGFATIAANSEIRDNQTFGVLRLTLHADGYTWRFVPIAGKTFTDTGSGFCH
jgi:PKD repeat protein